MHLLRTLLALALLACGLHASEPVSPPYDLTVAGQTYTVLAPDAGDYHRVKLPDGQVTSVQGDSTQALTAEALASALATPAPAPPVPVPAEVGAGQIRAAMIASGIAADVDALDVLILSKIAEAIEDATQRAIAAALWRHATAFKRNHAVITAVGSALEKSAAEIDDLFRLAATF